jgi:hypothetical protein
MEKQSKVSCIWRRPATFNSKNSLPDALKSKSSGKTVKSANSRKKDYKNNFNGGGSNISSSMSSMSGGDMNELYNV